MVSICLIGESGSGKSELAKYISSKGFENINYFTTRSPRFKEESGHVFIDNKYSDQIKSTLLSKKND